MNKINTENPFEVARFEKQMKRLCSSIKDETIKKYILEDFLSKINRLTPNVNLRKNFNFSKKLNSTMLNETKKIHLQKRSYTRENLTEFSILFILIFFSGALKSKLEKLKNLVFLDEENERLKNEIVKLYDQNLKEKEIENEVIKKDPDLVKRVKENSNLKIILNKKSYKQIEEIFEELVFRTQGI